MESKLLYQLVRISLLLFPVLCIGVSGISAQPPGFVPGEVLLRFVQGTSQHERVAEVSATVPLDLSGLDSVIRDLSERVGTTLHVKQLGSGNWLTLSVNREPLAAKIIQFLREQDGVGSVNLREGDEGSQAIRFALVVADNTALAEAVAARNENRQLANILEGWSSLLDVPLAATDDTDHLVIEVDWPSATMALVSKLNALGEVEAAQLNYSQMR